MSTLESFPHDPDITHQEDLETAKMWTRVCPPSWQCRRPIKSCQRITVTTPGRRLGGLPRMPHQSGPATDQPHARRRHPASGAAWLTERVSVAKLGLRT